MMFRTAIATLISATVVASNPLVSDNAPRWMGKAHSMHGRFLEDPSWMQFQQCQFLESPEMNLPGQQDPDNGLAVVTQRSVPIPKSSNQYAIYRVFPGPKTFCASDYNRDQYFIVNLDEYLEIAVRYHHRVQEEKCESCRETCKRTDLEIDEEEEAAGDDDTNDGKGRFLMDVDCDSCLYECDMIDNMEANGYFDATEFIQCAMVYDSEEDDGPGSQLYAGPMCSADGSKIKIGIFTDEECTKPDFSKDVEDYLIDEEGFSVKLSYALLKKAYSSDCFDCRDGGLCTELETCATVMEYDESIEVDKEDSERTEDDKEVGDSNISNSGCKHPERYTFVFTVLVLETAALLLTH